jgi:peptidoglycan-associated lipoprotein
MQPSVTKARAAGTYRALEARMSHRIIILSVALASAACSHEHPARTAANQAITTTTTATTSGNANGQREVIVSDDIVRTCQLHFSNTDQAPKFDYDQSGLLPEDASVLDQVAECVTNGPLKGRAVRLIGRADPRGEVEYNFALGESRATTVKRFLSGHGVDGHRISTTSRGKLDATGTDEDSWRRDRRVDIVLDNS